jgi:membrane protein DedA with SNARE-associated domain
LIAYPAGIAGMRLDKFIIYTAIGSTVWTALFVWIGFTLGGNLDAIEPYMHELTIVIIALVAAAVLWHVREPIMNIWRKKTTD